VGYFLISELIKIVKISCFTFVVKALGSYDFSLLHVVLYILDFLLYLHTYVLTNIRTFHGSIGVSPDNGMWDKLQIHIYTQFLKCTIL
jgi:hypothetical protein